MTSSKMGDDLVFYLNGRRVTETNIDPSVPIVVYLRETAKLTGTKTSCGIGACGACTVMVSDYNNVTASITHQAIHACRVPLGYMHGKALTTVEGVGSIRTKLDEVQEELVKSGGTQCGYCTPGFVMSMYALLKNDPAPCMETIRDAVKGNLCRCTGYRSILSGFASFSKREKCPLGDKCCRNSDSEKIADVQGEKEKKDISFARRAPSQELIFPPELQLRSAEFKASKLFKSDSVTWYRPSTLSELVQLKCEKPTSVFENGHLREVQTMGSMKTVISLSNVEELGKITLTSEGMKIGAGVTLTKLEKYLIENCTGDSYQALVHILGRSGNRQWKNVATIGQQLLKRGTTSDFNAVLAAYKGSVECLSTSGVVHSIALDSKFFKQDENPFGTGNIIVLLYLPSLPENTLVASFHEAAQNPIVPPLLNAGLRITFVGDTSVVSEALFVFGGSILQQTTVLPVTAAGVTNKVWDENVLHPTITSIEAELFGESTDVPKHNRILATGVFYKFYIKALLFLDKPIIGLSENEESVPKICQPLQQDFAKPVKINEHKCEEGKIGVGHPCPHVASKQQTTGEALFVNDIPPFDGELFLAFVLSTKAHAKIVSVDTRAALAMPGVKDYIDYKCVPGSNSSGYYIEKDEEIFASQYVYHYGTIIGGILATTASEAYKAADAVIVQYDEYPFIFTIEEAIATDSFYDFDHAHNLGDAVGEMANADHIIEDQVSIGGQLHLYGEANVCLVKPGENDEMEVYVPNHSLDSLQSAVASALGVPKSKLTMKTKRIGGSFGGKDSNSRRIVLPVAVAAYKAQKPVRALFKRDQDTAIMGGRHPMLAKFKIGFKSDGKLHALIADLYSNGGSSLDNSHYVLDWAMMQGDGPYYCPNVLWRGHVCKTNIRSPASFRGFGGPQGAFFYKTLINTVARKLGKPLDEVQETNFYVDRNLTPYHQTMTDAKYLHRCWQELKTNAQFQARKDSIEVFNSQNRTQKRGIALEAVKQGIGAVSAFLVQGAALVNVYNDGSVLLAHAGVEMGQGIHTKMIQVASQVLNIPVELIYVKENNTAQVPNPLPTISSYSSDTNGLAVIEACEEIIKRLAPFKEANPDGGWDQWVSAAFYTRTNLSAIGYGRVPGVYNFDWNNPASTPPFLYFTHGAMCSEVELDLLTGSYIVRQIDIVMDVGKSLNPNIDIGQIEGAFVQGLGWHCTEEEQWSDKGQLLSTNHDSYTIPRVTDIPSDFTVTLLKDSDNPKAVYSSKGIGEPAFLGASSVLYALQEALFAALRDTGQPNRPIVFDTPFTEERVRRFMVEQGISIPYKKLCQS